MDATWLPCCCVVGELQIEETMATVAWEFGPLQPAGPRGRSTRGRGGTFLTYEIKKSVFLGQPRLLGEGRTGWQL